MKTQVVSTVRADGVVRHARVTCANAFGAALAAHFGLPARQVMAGMEMHTKSDEIFGVTITLALTPDDLAGIARHMAAPAAKGQT